MKRLFLGLLLVAAPAFAQQDPDEMSDSAVEVQYTVEQLQEAAIAHYEFDDIYNLGYEGGDTSEPVADLENGSNHYATAGDVASFDSGDGISWAFAAWLRPETLAAVSRIAGKADASLNEGSWVVFAQSSNVFNCRIVDSAGSKTDSVSSSITDGLRMFVHCKYDATANEITAGVDGTWGLTPVSTASDGIRIAGSEFEVANYGGHTTSFDGTLGPAMFYRSASGGDLVSDDLLAMLYNGGKGKTCADLSATEKVNLVSCWEMTDAPVNESYEDSIGSNDLTATNGPIAQGPGLVRTGSGDATLDLTPVNTPTGTGGATGYAAEFTEVNSEYAQSVFNFTNPAEEYTVCAWIRLKSESGLQYMAIQYPGASSSGWYLTISTLTPGFTQRRPGEAVTIDTGANIAVGQRFYECGVSRASEIETYVNAVGSGSPTATTGYLGAIAQKLDVAAYVLGATYSDVVISQLAIWSEDTTAGDVMASTYNSGKGKTCGEMSGAELTNRVGCWDMSDPTDYVSYSDSTSPTTLHKLAGADAWGNHGARTTQTLSGNGWLEATMTLTGNVNYYAFGFTDATTVDSFDDIDFAVNPRGTGDIYECASGACADTGYDWDDDDVLRVEISENVVYIKQNGTTIYTFAAAPSAKYPLNGAGAILKTTASTLFPLGPFSSSFGTPVWIHDTNSGSGTSPLLAVNTPTQAAALVEQDRSGMGSAADATSIQYYTKGDLLLNHGGSMSACAWVFMNGTTGSRYIGGDAYTNDGWFLAVSGGTNVVTATWRGVGGNVCSAGGGVVNAGEWAHVCATINDGVRCDAWVNTNHPTPDTSPTGSHVAGTRNLYVESLFINNTAFDGVLDSFWLWNFDIGQAGVEAMYADGLGKFYGE